MIGLGHLGTPPVEVLLPAEFHTTQSRFQESSPSILVIGGADVIRSFRLSQMDRGIMPVHPQLLDAVRQQVDYYFSIDNLVKDMFLRRKMDDDGWIPTSVRLLPHIMCPPVFVRFMPSDCQGAASHCFLFRFWNSR
jgi:hypothetical protein